jgi:phosphatidylserine/phosphatidylglycerophosphate/cardiolipin synthase-like enzyme
VSILGVLIEAALLGKEFGAMLLRTVRTLEAQLVSGRELYQQVVLDKMLQARESVWISTANVKEMYVEQSGDFRSILEVFEGLAARGVELKLLHAELPSRPFRSRFDKSKRLVKGGLQLKVCPRVHFKAVVVDNAWVYLGSANLTGAGLGAKDEHRRNFELGFVTEDFDTLDRTVALFESVWGGAECRNCKLFSLCPDPIGEGPRRPKKKSRRDVGIELGRSRRLSRGGR